MGLDQTWFKIFAFEIITRLKYRALIMSSLN